MLPNIVPDALGAFFLFVRSLHSTQESVAFSPSAMHFFRHHHSGRQTMQLHTFFTNKINLAFITENKPSILSRNCIRWQDSFVAYHYFPTQICYKSDKLCYYCKYLIFSSL